MHPFLRHLFRSKDPQGLPTEIYISTVDALYSDSRSLFLGTLSASMAAVVTALAAREPVLAVCAVLLAVLGGLRALDMKAYGALGRLPKTVEEARWWEGRYSACSTGFIGLLGLWCFFCFALTSDAAVRLIGFAVSLGYLVGVVGRNFSSDRLVTLQAIASGVPMIAALLIQNNVYYAFLAVLLAPFFTSIRFISARLRKILFDAVLATHAVTAIANRFDTALNNMPHGLCMVDASQRLDVSNSRFLKLLRIGERREWRGVSMQEMINEAVADGALADAGEALAADILDRMVSGLSSSLTIESIHDVALQFTFQPMDNGGCVILLEDISERRDAEAQIERLASYDALTGLANRTLFQRKFDEGIRDKSGRHTYAVHFIDLDLFKRVNDTLGHPTGDALLCAVADRLREIVRRTDYVSRFGGDEFVVLQPILRDRPTAADELASRIIDRLNAPYRIGEHDITIGASIGIALASDSAGGFDDIMKKADMALYAAKAEGRGIYRYFQQDMDVKAQARRTLEIGIRRALENGEFKVFYQPILDVKTGRVTSCEALVRWAHPERGLISPAEFIPVAEEMGLIVRLGDIVLRQACTECRSWPDGVSVAVNISSIQFRRGDVPASVERVLKETGLEPGRLIVEITESVLLEDTDSTRATLARLRDIGVRVALDDFGTGYSSLSYLHMFPLNKIKIDRSFLLGVEDDPRTLILLRGVSRLCKELSMAVVIEGVERQSQLNVLLAEGVVDEIQGYLFGRPQPSEMIVKTLGKQRPMEIRRVA